MDRMAILAKTQKWCEETSEKGRGLQQPPPPLLRERVNIKQNFKNRKSKMAGIGGHLGFLFCYLGNSS